MYKHYLSFPSFPYGGRKERNREVVLNPNLIVLTLAITLNKVSSKCWRHYAW